ncbi:MAG: type I restriction-modification system subunit M N-terminal domain-containing protein [Solirubrobacteraceae bacterium]
MDDGPNRSVRPWRVPPCGQRVNGARSEKSRRGDGPGRIDSRAQAVALPVAAAEARERAVVHQATLELSRAAAAAVRRPPARRRREPCPSARDHTSCCEDPPMPDLAELEKRLWDAANEPRANSGLKASEYGSPVLGLIFLRFADASWSPSARTSSTR